MLILGLYLVLLISQNIYAKSNKSSSISTFDESVNMLINGVKVENIVLYLENFTYVIYSK